VPDPRLQRVPGTQDAPRGCPGKVVESSIRGLVDLRATIAQLPLEETVTAMAAARQFVFIGVGASGHVASDAAHKFFRLGIPCTTALDAQTILQRAAMATKGDLFVTISHTGVWPEIVRAMALARSRGACIVAVTDPASPLADEADLLIGCHAREDTSVFTPMSSRLVHLALLDALQVSLALRLGEPAEENLRLTKEALRVTRNPG
jgi:RpiR family carbohydrate utilization transcriptional regulator